MERQAIQNLNIKDFEAQEKGTNPFTIWNDIGTATEGTKELMKIMSGKKIFDLYLD